MEHGFRKVRPDIHYLAEERGAKLGEEEENVEVKQDKGGFGCGEIGVVHQS